MNPDLVSIGGIVALTLILVEILKRGIGYAQKRSTWLLWDMLGVLPTWVWACVVAAGLTVFARFVVHSIDGGAWALVGKAIMSAAAAGGFVEWRRTGLAPIDESKTALGTRYPSTGSGQAGGDEDTGNKSLNMWGIIVACAMLILAAGGCISDRAYIEADRETFSAIAPEYSAYVQDDTRLSGEQKDRRHRTIASWLLRLQRGEQQLRATKTQPTTQP